MYESSMSATIVYPIGNTRNLSIDVKCFLDEKDKLYHVEAISHDTGDKEEGYYEKTFEDMADAVEKFNYICMRAFYGKWWTELKYEKPQYTHNLFFEAPGDRKND